VLIAITSNGKIGLGVLAGLFIAFALLSSFYFPRRDPNFPGRRLGLFIAVAALLFVGTMAGVVFFAKEEEHAEAAATHGGETAEEPATTETEPTETETGATDTTETTGETGEAGNAEGDPAAGEQVFASAGCGGCHTLEAAGSSGTVGPNLDEAKPSHDLVVERVTNGMSPMPSFKDQLSDQQIQDVAAYVVESTQG
jgi:mono/diheme cytochrome c family protein